MVRISFFMQASCQDSDMSETALPAFPAALFDMPAPVAQFIVADPVTAEI